MVPSENAQFHILTDDTLRETISHGNGRYPFACYLENIWEFDFHHVDWHWHPEVEFLSVSSGTAICLIGENRVILPAGSGLFVNSGILHRYESEGSTVVPNIVFSPSLLTSVDSLIYEKYILPVIHSNTAYQILDPQITWQNDILKTLENIYRLQESENPDELQTLQLIIKIWISLSQHFPANSDTHGIRHTNHRQAKLQLMMQYIHDHYREEISLDQIASAAAVSKSSALNIFQTGIHTSPVSYLIQYRLRCAGELLCTTKKPVSSIAEETGFSSSGYFCRKFKEHYQMTPNEYRQKKFR